MSRSQAEAWLLFIGEIFEKGKIKILEERKRYDMKRTILILGIIVIALGGCTLRKESNQMLENIVTQEVPNDIHTDLHTLPQEIQDIIYRDGTFFDVESQKQYTKKSYKVQNLENIMQETKWGKYLICDFDEDGEQELVVRLQNMEGYCLDTKVFDKQENMVYAYSFVYRGFLHVYEDGTIDSSSAADTFYYYKLKFNKEKCEETVIADSTWVEDEKVWYIEGKKVTEEEFYNFINKNYGINTEILWSSSSLESKLLQEEISKLPIRKKNEIVYNVDITEDGSADTITVDISKTESIWKQKAVISVKDSNGDKIWSDEMELSDTSCKLYYLCKKDEKYCLLRYITKYQEGDGSYTFEVFYPKEKEEKVIDSQKVQFQTYPIGKYEVNLPISDMYDFAEEVNDYFYNGILLLGVEDGEFKYTTDNIPVTYEEKYKKVVPEKIQKENLYLEGQLAIMREKILEESKEK